MNLTRVSYTLDSSLESVNKAEEAASEVARKCGFDEDAVSGISMAVREAAVNAVLHGNRYDPNKRITIAFEASNENLSVAVRDEGPGLDPESVPNPLEPENLLKQSGRGIFLIRAFMDEVSFRRLSPGTEIHMTKRIHENTRGKEDSK